MNKNKKIKFRRGILSLGMLSIFAIPTIAAHADSIASYGIKDNDARTGYYAYAYTQSSSNVAVAKIKKHYCTIADPNVQTWSSYTTDKSDNGWAQTDTIGGSTTVGFKSQHESEDQIAYDQAGQ